MESTTPAADLAAALADATGRHVADRPGHPVGGGSINECVQWLASDGPLFVKLADADRLEMFEAEAEGLHELQRAAAGACAVRAGAGRRRGSCVPGAGVDRFRAEHAADRGDARRAARGVAPRDRRTVRLASRQHHRRHAAAERLDRRVARFLRPPPAGLTSSISPSGTATAAAGSSVAARCASGSMLSSTDIDCNRRCCMATCGAATGRRMLAARRCCSTRRCTTAIARRTSR